jgi:type I restriction enzyme, S subunit
MSEKLPKGWVMTTLGEIAGLSQERALPTDTPTLRYVGLEHIEPQTMKLLGHGYARESRSSLVRFSKGDVLYGKMRPYLNKVWVAEFDGLCSAEFLVFSKYSGLNSKFLALRLNAEDFVAFANGQISGERPRVDFGKLSSFPIALPPTSEQDRIVAKLEAALSRVQRAESHPKPNDGLLSRPAAQSAAKPLRSA